MGKHLNLGHIAPVNAPVADDGDAGTVETLLVENPVHLVTGRFGNRGNIRNPRSTPAPSAGVTRRKDGLGVTYLRNND